MGRANQEARIARAWDPQEAYRTGPDGYFERNRRWLESRKFALRQDLHFYRTQGDEAMVEATKAWLNYFAEAGRG